MKLQSFVLGALTFLLAGAVSCATTDSNQADDSLTPSACGETGRADDIVRKTAIAEFEQLGKHCEAYEVSTFAQNERETVWRACCGGAGLTYVYFPSKCVARKSSGLITCKE